MKRRLTQHLIRAVIGLALVAGVEAFGAQCAFSISPSAAGVGFGGASGTVTVTMTSGNGCAWTSISAASWVQATNSGTGSGVATYTVEPNPGPATRQATITVAGKPFTITQAGVPVSLGGALDAPALTWATSASHPWVSTNAPDPTFDGLHSATSGNKYVDDSASWLQTTVTGPGTLSFWWRVDSDVTDPPPEVAWSWDALQFLINDEVQDEIMGQIEWCYRTYPLPAGTHTLKWNYLKDAQYSWGADKAWVDRVSYVTGATTPLQAALDTCGVSWSSGGNTNPTYWALEPGSSRTGGAAARSGAVTHSQESSLQTTIVGVTNVSFWWRVSSEANADYLEFLTNGTLATRITGETTWASNYFRLSSGSNTLSWRYVKNSYDLGAKGSDAGWVDEVRFSPTPPPSAYRLGSTTRLADGRVQLTLEGEAGCPCAVQSSANLVDWQVVTNLITSGLITPVTDETAGGTNNLRFYRVRSLP